VIKGCAKKLISAIAIFLFFIITAPALAQGGSYNFVNQSGLNTAGSKAGYSDTLKALNPENLSSQIINIVLSILGLIFIGLIIYGGLTWMLAEGNEQKLEKAKQIILASIIGLIVVLAAYAASYFIISYFSAKTLS
jgi:cytochrome bd-type quinol oxidase subunit 2